MYQKLMVAMDHGNRGKQQILYRGKTDTESWLNEKVTAFFLTYRKIRDS